MSRETIMERLREILRDTYGEGGDPPEFTEASRLMEDLGFSSVDMLYLIIATEESFGIRFQNVGILDLPTVGAVVDYIGAALG